MRRARSWSTVLLAGACIGTSPATPPVKPRPYFAGWWSTTVSKPARNRIVRLGMVIAAAVVAVSLVPTINRAQSNELNVQFHGFQDTRSVSVLSPTIDFARDVNDRASLRAN